MMLTALRRSARRLVSHASLSSVSATLGCLHKCCFQHGGSSLSRSFPLSLPVSVGRRCVGTVPRAVSTIIRHVPESPPERVGETLRIPIMRQRQGGQGREIGEAEEAETGGKRASSGRVPSEGLGERGVGGEKEEGRDAFEALMGALEVLDAQQGETESVRQMCEELKAANERLEAELCAAQQHGLWVGTRLRLVERKLSELVSLSEHSESSASSSSASSSVSGGSSPSSRSGARSLRWGEGEHEEEEDDRDGRPFPHRRSPLSFEGSDSTNCRDGMDEWGEEAGRRDAKKRQRRPPPLSQSLCPPSPSSSSSSSSTDPIFLMPRQVFDFVSPETHDTKDKNPVTYPTARSSISAHPDVPAHWRSLERDRARRVGLRGLKLKEKVDAAVLEKEKEKLRAGRQTEADLDVKRRNTPRLKAQEAPPTSSSPERSSAAAPSHLYDQTAGVSLLPGPHSTSFLGHAGVLEKGSVGSQEAAMFFCAGVWCLTGVSLVLLLWTFVRQRRQHRRKLEKARSEKEREEQESLAMEREREKKGQQLQW
uniref:Transmembrane protein n=1 Tax=Chromera velia CCMP2878 TaxID=1169474 RepID=A0A0G4I465_9ALVE|eukprot:Cvel_10783.t1-p1 / transcript=Cvel_10783.t1 / gene=Cvel_10783 / organism=Chromera_velia_CCMP2878 / gene_product=hypothetical protein / transcript_product=hypothetical protein / location=Cvel_scaffold659:1266-4883(+) / protein_length=538 / sequence_SO=supercontig / SO=protein_coding / is_pseudo=false